MKQLLEIDFASTFGIKANNLFADELWTQDHQFDIDDMQSPIKTKPFGSGKLSINNNGILGIVHYENFIDQCKETKSFWNGRKKCDYIIHDSANKSFVLVEITSAYGLLENLSKPITKKDKKTVMFPGGKFEKCEVQLSKSLDDLMSVPKIRAKINAYTNKICLMAYRLYPTQDPTKKFQAPFSRYLKIEAQETGRNGAIISCQPIEALGFEYRRIEHSNIFQI